VHRKSSPVSSVLYSLQLDIHDAGILALYQQISTGT